MQQRRLYLKDRMPVEIGVSTLRRLDSKYVCTNVFVELYAPCGIFMISKKGNIVKRTPVDGTIEECALEDGTQFLADESFFHDEPVLSQIPYHHSAHFKTAFHYGDGSVQLIIEGTYRDKDHLSKTDKYDGFLPDNFYFLANDDIESYLVKKELNVFLSLLN